MANRADPCLKHKGNWLISPQSGEIINFTDFHPSEDLGISRLGDPNTRPEKSEKCPFLTPKGVRNGFVTARVLIPRRPKTVLKSIKSIKKG